MNTGSFLSKNVVLTWIGVWKILDVWSTFTVAGQLGWSIEMNWLARILSYMIGELAYPLVVVFTVPLALFLAWKGWQNFSVVAELLAFTLPFIVLSNYMILYNVSIHLVIIHSVMVAVVLYVGVSIYLHYRKGKDKYQGFVVGGKTYF